MTVVIYATGVIFSSYAFLFVDDRVISAFLGSRLLLLFVLI